MTDPWKEAEQAIRARLEAATRGPWRASRNAHGDGYVRFGGTVAASGRLVDGYNLLIDCDEWAADPNAPADAEFIAHAPEDIAALLAAIESRDQRIRELEERVELYRLDHSVRSIVRSEPY